MFGLYGNVFGKALPAGKEEIESNLKAPETSLSERTRIAAVTGGPPMSLGCSLALLSFQPLLPGASSLDHQVPRLTQGLEVLGDRHRPRKPSTTSSGQSMYKPPGGLTLLSEKNLFYFGITLDSQKSCQIAQSSCMLFIQLPLMLRTWVFIIQRSGLGNWCWHETMS